MIKKLLLTCILSLAILAGYSQKTFDGGAGGTGTDWGTDENWNPDGVPVASDNVTIPDGFNVVIGSATDAEATALTIEGSSSLEVTGTLTTTGQITVESSATLTVTGTVTGSGFLAALGTIGIDAGATFTTGTVFLTGGTVTVDGVSAQLNVNGSITVQNGGALSVLNSGDVNISANLEIKTGCTATVDQGNLHVNRNLKVDGTLNHVNGGQVTVGTVVN